VRLTILAIGKLKEAWLQTGCEEYLKRLRPRLPVEVIELRDCKQIARHVPPRHVLWALDERGEEPTSVGFAAKLREAMGSGLPGIVMLIGGPDGLPQEVLRDAQHRLALSRLTLPHRLVRVLLLEQIYRALSILNDEPYHRA
jgi:23S rRNA (pseudouridine1915-N3)-methyltransferase